ncbi:anion transporter [Candidatus Fermentibacteria bacterium]|nr:anion transporter [Candidatus Fermentibacteria bacterium]
MREILTGCAIGLALLGVAMGRFPWLRMNRATIALVGAVVLVLMGAISLEEAFDSLDLSTLVLLFAMMVLNVNLSICGFFRLLTARILCWAKTPRQLLALVVMSSGVLSALFLNDTVVLMFTPLVIRVTRQVGRNPIPYLVALATAANIGSTATIIGNPQNMLIGISSGIPFARFAALLSPVSLIGLGLAWVVVFLVYRSQFRSERLASFVTVETRTYRPLLRKSLAAAALMILGLLAGMPIPLASMAAASLLLVTRRLKPERVFREIDWSLLVFFSGLFVVTKALETTGLSARLFALARPLGQGVLGLTAASAVLSNLISNVPAVLMFRPLVPAFPNVEKSWLVLAMATTLAGNLTLLGSVANLIVAESARRSGVRLTFLHYLRAGVPITILTLAWGALWLSLM